MLTCLRGAVFFETQCSVFYGLSLRCTAHQQNENWYIDSNLCKHTQERHYKLQIPFPTHLTVF